MLQVLIEDEGRDALTEQEIARAFDLGCKAAIDGWDGVSDPYGEDGFLVDWWQRGHRYGRAVREARLGAQNRRNGNGYSMVDRASIDV